MPASAKVFGNTRDNPFEILAGQGGVIKKRPNTSAVKIGFNEIWVQTQRRIEVLQRRSIATEPGIRDAAIHMNWSQIWVTDLDRFGEVLDRLLVGASRY